MPTDGSTVMPTLSTGGNMDLTDAGPGSTVYLPVQVPGALLSIGDLHAVMARGESSFVAIEIAGQNDPGGKGRQRQQQAAEQRARRQRMGCGGGALHGGILVSEKGERRDTTQPHSDEVPYILHLCDGGVKGGQLRSHVSLLAPVSVRSPAEPMQKVVKHTEHR